MKYNCKITISSIKIRTGSQLPVERNKMQVLKVDQRTPSGEGKKEKKNIYRTEK